MDVKMTIAEALKANKIDRIIVGNRWLYFAADRSEYGDERNNFVVREYWQVKGLDYYRIRKD